MNVLFVGAFPPNFLINRSAGRIDSLYRDDQAVIKGIRAQENVRFRVLTSPDIYSWPKGPLFIHREENESEGLTMVSSLNLSLIKQLWTIISMTKDACKYIRQCEGKVVVIIPYIVFRHLCTLRLLKWLYPKKVVQTVIVPDIFFPSNWIRKGVNHLAERMASRCDAFVLYTQKMADYLNLIDGRYLVIEGFRDILNRRPVRTKDFRVVYAGSLNLKYGVGRLMEAMNLVNDKDVFLHLYGAGTAEPLIKENALKDNRIIFHGKVPNDEATDAIYSASVLINPRNASDGEFTEYSFPSKDIEYMSTGIPTLLCKLPGMPQEYSGHFVDIGEGKPDQIARAITQVKQMTKEERDAIGLDARSFITERMDCNKQAKRIIDLFESIINEQR